MIILLGCAPEARFYAYTYTLHVRLFSVSSKNVQYKKSLLTVYLWQNWLAKCTVVPGGFSLFLRTIFADAKNTVHGKYCMVISLAHFNPQICQFLRGCVYEIRLIMYKRIAWVLCFLFASYGNKQKWFLDALRRSWPSTSLRSSFRLASYISLALFLGCAPTIL